MSRPRRRIRAVVFDLDDTLYLERNYVRSGYSAVAAHLRRRLARADRFEQWMWKRFAAGKGEKIFNALSERFGLRLGSGGIAELVGVYRRHRPRIGPARGVRELLGDLRRRRIKLGILSDGFLPAQQLKLQALDIGQYFQAVVLTERLGRAAWKPSSRGFELIRRRLAVPHAACAYVADNPAKDFLAPNRLGWLTAQWRRTGQVHAAKSAPAGGKPDRVIRSGPQLRRLLSEE